MADPDNTDGVALELYEEDVVADEMMDWEPEVSDRKSATCDSESSVVVQLDKCIICKNDTDETVSVLGRGMATLVADCQLIGRVDILNVLEDKKDSQFVIHGSCRRRLAYEKRRFLNTEACCSGVAKSTARRLTRSITGGFCFENMCFLCGKATSDSKDVRKVLSGEGFDKKMKDVIHERNYDTWALQVKGRMESVSDLFAADAVYHRYCHSRFSSKLPHTPHKLKRGRPHQEDAMNVFEKLCDKLERECENEMYTLSQLHDLMFDMSENKSDLTVYSKVYLKELLQKRYGDHIYFASRTGRDDVVGFSNFCDLVLHNKFFSDRNEGEGTEAEKLVQKAAGLILAEIREMDCNREFYPTSDDVTSDGLKFLPPLLTLFMKRLVRSPLKQAALGQGLVQAARPQGSIMPLLFGVGVDLDMFGVQQLHIKLSRLGFTLSCDEIRRYKHSVMQIPGHDVALKLSDPSPVVHFVADNVDHNVKTLDGFGTFHGMGIISATAFPPGVIGNTQKVVRRLEKPMKVREATRGNKCVPIISFSHSNEQGLKSVKLCSIKSLQRPLTLPAILNLNSLWHAAGPIGPSKQPHSNWSGFMQSVCLGDHTGVSAVEMLSIVDLNPSDEDCIHSTLLFVIDQAKSLNIQTPNITFDQPLYIKAVDVAIKSNLDIVIRLGGFHTLMSFLGAVGHVMKGSGLEEVLGMIYGPNTIEHVIGGKAYERAVRGHFLVHAALTELLLEYLKNPMSDEDNLSAVVISSDSTSLLAGAFPPSMTSELDALYERILHDKVQASDHNLIECDSLVYLNILLQDLKHALFEQSRTSRLWLLYMRCVDILKQFLLAERTGNWLLHLHTVQSMMSLFAATGHINYAKSSRLYVQQMENLEKSHPLLHEQFLQGFHSIRRSDRYWSGLSCDLVIEQTMMRAIKSRGGLTRGRGMEETVRETWLNTLTTCSSIRSALSNVTKAERSTEEHVEVGLSRMRRDFADFFKIKHYLQLYSPFRFLHNSSLIHLSSGVVAHAEDMVDCERAEEIGIGIQKKWDDCCYGDIVCKRSEQVKTMSDFTSSCSVEKEKVSIDPNSLFHRLILVGERADNVKECFEYELTPYPLSLFKDGLMRKPDKPSLYKDFIVGLTDSPVPSVVQYVVDGGYLLHKVRSHDGHVLDTCIVFYVFKEIWSPYTLFLMGIHPYHFGASFWWWDALPHTNQLGLRWNLEDIEFPPPLNIFELKCSVLPGQPSRLLEPILNYDPTLFSLWM